MLHTIFLIRTCYNWYYNSSFLARQQLSLKRDFSRGGAQIIISEIIQTDDKNFSKIESMFFEVNPRRPHENISNFKKYIFTYLIEMFFYQLWFWDLVGHTEDQRL